MFETTIDSATTVSVFKCKYLNSLYYEGSDLNAFAKHISIHLHVFICSRDISSTTTSTVNLDFIFLYEISPIYGFWKM